MDFRSLKSKFNKRPEEWHPIGNHKFLIRLPQKTRMNEIISSCSVNGKIDQAAFIKMARPICEQFIVDWDNVTVEDLSVGWDIDSSVNLDEPVDFGPQALAVYLDDHTDEMADIAVTAMSMWEKRAQKDEKGKKLSKSG